MTATTGEVLNGYKFVGSGTDDVQTGALQLTGNAVVNHVTSGTTFYTTNVNQKLTGTMTVNNITAFSVTLSSGRIVTAKWTNPIQTLGKPYSGVYIRYQTGSYPTLTTGTQIYKGLGNNSGSGAQSQVTLTLPNLSTTYYFICYSYCLTSNGELLGTQLRATVNTGSVQTITITSSRNYTIPSGYNTMDVFCVGGGGAGKHGRYSGGTTSGYYYYPGGGGGGGYTSSVGNIAISAGQVLVCSIGMGGAAQTTDTNAKASSGGISSVSMNGTVLCSALGGEGGGSGSLSGARDGGNGGSGGGRGAVGGRRELGNTELPETKAGNGGSNGSNGYKGTGGYFIYSGNAQYPGTGQGTTTRPFNESTGTLYSAGGGGGIGLNSVAPGDGGVLGGGRGGSFTYDSGTSSNPIPGGNASANTGSGGGGGTGNPTPIIWASGAGGAGGSGIILIRLK